MAEEEKKRVTLTQEQVLQAYQENEMELNDIRQRIGMIQSLLSENFAATEALNEIKEGKSEKIMVNLGAGVYADATLEQSKTVKTTLGANVLANTSIEKTLETLAKRKENLEKDMQTLAQAQQQLIQNMETLRQIIMQAEDVLRQAQQQQKNAKK